jgi:hypothetical protein
MAYVPDWERLSDVLKRVTAAGVSEIEAKLDISRAVADRKIRGRLTVAMETDIAATWHQMVTNAQGLGTGPNHLAGSVECFEGGNINVPSHLLPGDFDWQDSRPLLPWPIRPRDGRLNEWKSRLASLLELRTTEVLAWIQRTYISTTHEAAAPRDITDSQAKRNATAGQETTAIGALALQLKSNPQMSRADAAGWCKTAGHDLGKRAFNRVWPQARQTAGLSRIAAPGRKQKSSR